MLRPTLHNEPLLLTAHVAVLADTKAKSSKWEKLVDDSYTLIATREIDAPAERVWEAWNNPEKIAKWWGPAGFHSTVKELDVREGGRFEVIMHGPDGTDFPNLYVFEKARFSK